VEDLILGICFMMAVGAVSARIALRPITDAIIRLGQAFPGASNALAPGDRRVAQLERQVAELSEQVQRLEQVEQFHRELANGTPRTPLPTTRP
jgi:TolA-binding protein